MLNSKKAVLLVAKVTVIRSVGAGTATGSPERGRHCVVEVLDQLESGEFVISEPVCFETLAETLAGDEAGILPPGTVYESALRRPRVVVSEPGVRPAG